MTPEEKANDLFQKYRRVQRTDHTPTEGALQFTLIAVDEIISILETFGQHEYAKILLPHYQQVKQHIENQSK